jgi:Flp pilus assembly protein TadG
MSREDSFTADRRGAVAFETIVVWFFLMFGLLLPLADVAIAGFQYISAYQALRDLGQRTQYSPPSDVTSSASMTSWANSLPASVGNYAITAQVYCGAPGTLAPCASGATGPKYYTFTTSFSLSPLVLGKLLCSTCTVNYSLPFQ